MTEREKKPEKPTPAPEPKPYPTIPFERDLNIPKRELPGEKR
ncbi:MAG TPA: hypothetical protein ACFYD3_11700 [Candidatus Hypogeohydataceae bacterium YC41]